MTINKTIISAVVAAVLVCWLCPTELLAYPKEDKKLWMHFEFKYSATDDLTLRFSEEIRLYKDRDIVEQRLHEIGATYRVEKWFRVGLFYRYKTYNDEQRPKRDKYANEVFSNFSFRTKLQGINFNNRVRVHLRFKDKEDNSYFLRNKLTAEYKNLSDWFSPFASAEVSHRVGAGTNNNINRTRYEVGINFTPWKHSEFSLYFTRENEHNKRKIVNSDIIGIGYELSL